VADTRDAAIKGASFSDQFPARAFYCTAQWGDGPSAASYMPFEEAERIIQVCAEAYLKATKRGA
jgi:hypothetical protein